jgi:hypothetical protein
MAAVVGACDRGGLTGDLRPRLAGVNAELRLQIELWHPSLCLAVYSASLLLLTAMGDWY